jgi:hypothetical protein
LFGSVVFLPAYYLCAQFIIPLSALSVSANNLYALFYLPHKAAFNLDCYVFFAAYYLCAEFISPLWCRSAFQSLISAIGIV